MCNFVLNTLSTNCNSFFFFYHNQMLNFNLAPFFSVLVKYMFPVDGIYQTAIQHDFAYVKNRFLLQTVTDDQL